MNTTFRQLPLLFYFLFLINPVFADSLSPHHELVGILFYKSDCIECEEVLYQVIPGAIEKSGSQGDILAVNNSTPAGGQLFLEFLISRELPPSMQLPILITEYDIWSGKNNISNGLIKLLNTRQQPLSLDHVQNKELFTNLQNPESSQLIQAAFWISKETKPKQKNRLIQFAQNYQKDPVGNGLAVVVLLGMIGSLFYIALQFRQKQTAKESKISFLYPVLCFLALLIAAYLFMSGLAESELSCGPVGECNAVQQSKYSRIFDIIPVSLLGMVGYLTCIFSWLISNIVSSNKHQIFIISAWACSVFSVCFFIYLTFLEPFVIGATCIWCISSAILTSISALISTKPALSAIRS